MASALASGDTSETWLNSTSSNGTSPSVMAHWMRTQSASQPARRSRPVPTYKIRATAPKDSQKPADWIAQGSMATTANRAAARNQAADVALPLINAIATTASISTVRWAGTPKPDNSE